MQPTALASMRGLSQGLRCFYSPITLTDVYTGVRPHEARWTEEFFSWLHCADVTELIGRKAGDSMAEFHGSNGHYPMRDLRIWEAEQS